MVARLVLVVAVVALGGGALFLATGGLGRALAALGTTVGGFVDDLRATPAPSVNVGIVADSPVIESPQEPYTNQAAVDLVVLIPKALVGHAETRVRVFRAVGDAQSTQIAEVAIGSSPRVVVPHVALASGSNDFTATLDGPAGESEASAVVTFVLDQAKPKVTLTSPKDNSTINGQTVTIAGKTQGRSTLVARNDVNGASVVGVATADGTFRLIVPLAPGSNAVVIESTDPAGNVGALALTYRRGTGKLTAKLNASAYRFSRAKLPDPLELTVLVADPDGRALAGARVTFSVSIPGVGPITSDRVTGSDGRAVFKTAVPKGAAVGTGPVSVLVTAAPFGNATDKTVITVTK